MSKEDIERMVQEAETYKAEDDEQRDKVAVKNDLESYAFNIKSTMADEKLKRKISEQERQKAVDKCNEVISWLDLNQVWSSFIWIFQLISIRLIILCVFVSSLQERMSFSISRGSWRKFVTPSWPNSTSPLKGCPAGHRHHQALPLRRWIKSRVCSAFSHGVIF